MEKHINACKCGETPEMRNTQGAAGPWFWCSCPNCCTFSSGAATRDEAIDKWNACSSG